MIALGLWGALLCLRGGPERSRAYLWSAVVMAPAGFIAVLAGWTTAEVGRQPYVVFGAMRTAQAVSPVHPGVVAASLIAFLAVYALVFSVGALYIVRLIAEGPVSGAAEPAPAGPRAPGSPLAAVPDLDAQDPLPERASADEEGP
jgi:cytochrome d ubiquinol oxidase subunit I